MSQINPLVVLGGNSLVAPYLIQRLVAEGIQGEVISRRPLAPKSGLTMTQLDLSQARNWVAPEEAIIFSLLPLWVLGQLLPRLIGVRAIIALGSTSLFSKMESQDLKERSTAAHLELAEDAFQAWAQRCNVSWTLLRTTMIYDGIADKNITRMASFIRQFRIMPLADPAAGLRQPIHADDVAKALMLSLNNAAVENKSFNIAGGEILSYRAMVERVYEGLGRKPRIKMFPTNFLENMYSIISRLGVVSPGSFSASVFHRMNENLVFDVKEGLQLLNYQPRAFRPTFPKSP